MFKKLIFILFISGCCYAQQLTPSPLEQEKLAKLKAQKEMLTERLTAINAQITAYQQYREITNNIMQQKRAEWETFVEDVKKAHQKEWGQSELVNYDKEAGEGGTFNKAKEEKK